MKIPVMENQARNYQIKQRIKFIPLVMLEDREIDFGEVLMEEREETRSLVAVLGALSGKEHEGWRVAVETMEEFAPMNRVLVTPIQANEQGLVTVFIYLFLEGLFDNFQIVGNSAKKQFLDKIKEEIILLPSFIF